MSILRRPALLLAVAVLAAACTSDPVTDATPQPSDTGTVETPSTPAAATTDPTPQGAASASPEASPSTVPLDVVARHPSGVTMKVLGLTHRRGGVGLDVEVTNGASEEAVLASQPNLVTMTDDGGAALEFVPPDDNPELVVAPGDQLAGQLAFSGALSSDATAVTVRFNYDRGDPINDDFTAASIVSFEFADLPLSGDDDRVGTEQDEDAGRAEADVEVREEHPGGVVLEVSKVTTEGDGIFLTVRAVNTDDNEGTELAVAPDLTYLEDDLGNRYRLNPPADNPQLDIEPGEELAGDIAFVGPVDDDATRLALYTNHRSSGKPMNLDKPAPGSVSFVVEDLPVP